LTVARLGREKNLELLLAALAASENPALQLAIVGEGPAREGLEQYARTLGIGSRVRFLGQVDRVRLPDMYASADAFLFSSVTDTQGIVLAEALAAGCSIIAVDTPQTREVLGEAAAYVPNDVGALAEALASIEAPPSARGRDAARAASRRFSRDLQSELTLQLYQDLICEQATPPS
jgi:1,2-diacylglycerol 3-alpha-glucosyltransferase